MAVAVVVAGLTIARHRGEQRQAETRASQDEAPVAVDPTLEAIRSAGF